MSEGTYSTVDDISLWQILISQDLIHFDRRSQKAQFYQTHTWNVYHKLLICKEKPIYYLLQRLHLTDVETEAQRAKIPYSK